MTNKELQEILSKYPPDMPMQAVVNCSISDVMKVDRCVDMGTNKVSLVVYGQDRDYFKREPEDEKTVVLPCKPKDIVYFIGCDFSKCSAYGEEYDESGCQGCEVSCDSVKTYSVYTTRAEDLRWILRNYFDFGKIYFSNKQEAEEALIKMNK